MDVSGNCYNVKYVVIAGQDDPKSHQGILWRTKWIPCSEAQWQNHRARDPGDQP
jgi:hypothetical protein